MKAIRRVSLTAAAVALAGVPAFAAAELMIVGNDQKVT